MGQQTEFPCPEMCRGLWIKKLWCPSLEGYGPTDGVPMSRNVQGAVDKNSSAPPLRDTGQKTEFPCPEMCREPWIKTPEPLPGGIWANRWSSHVQKCAGVQSPFLKGYRPMDRVCMTGKVQGSMDQNSKAPS